MMQINFPFYLSALFILTTLLAISILIWVVKGSSNYSVRKIYMILGGLVVWLGIQAVLSLLDVYNTDLSAQPPKILLLGILPAVVCVIFLFIRKVRKSFYRRSAFGKTHLY